MGDYDDEPPTPTELIPEPHPPRSQADLDRAEVQRLNTRVAELERDVDRLRADVDRGGRFWRTLRVALAKWLRED
jgi:hypothetical protein